MNFSAKWIRPERDMGDVATVFHRSFDLNKAVKKAELLVTAMGIYEAKLNGARVGEFVLAPGWTSYYHRLQVQAYDVGAMLQAHNALEVTVGKGWYRSRMVGWQPCPIQEKLRALPCGLFAELRILFEDGSAVTLPSDAGWTASESPVRFSEIYDGEIFDAGFTAEEMEKVCCFDGPLDTLIPQEGEEVREQEHLHAARMFVTPRGETVIDFGQNLTGYVASTVTARAGEVLDLSFAEVLDREGNFYTDNYRTAKAQYRYLCRDGLQTYKPHLTFWGFRYIRVNAFPGGTDKVTPECFEAIALYSEMKRTGFLASSNPRLNQLFSNVFWGQKGNFVDIPTDCPQRDERLGWTGDAQVFCRAACLNYDAEKFFTKWLNDLKADQRADGYVGHVIPDLLAAKDASAAWGDAATVCPWEVYMAYGNPDILRRQFASMCGWVRHIRSVTKDEGLWTGSEHFADWLGLDAPSGSYKGSTREDLIASAFYAFSTELVIRAGRILGEDVREYEALYKTIVAAFRKAYPVCKTQTECVLAAHFRIAENPQAVADQLAEMVSAAGTKLQTGFVGTPYILHVLSDYGHADLAWSLMLREQYPSWLYPVTKGATTVWEHWDSIMEDGGFWSKDMNSFNHYAYGAVLDWVYGTAAGIRPRTPGYATAMIAPQPDARLDWLRVELDTRHGRIVSEWKKCEGRWRYEITTPVASEIVIAGVRREVQPGSYCFFSEI